MSQPRFSTQPAQLDSIAYQLEQLLKRIVMPTNASPEEIAARRQASVDAFWALGPRDALEASLASSLLAIRNSVEHMLRLAAERGQSDPNLRKLYQQIRSMTRLAAQFLDDLKKRQRGPVPVPNIAGLCVAECHAAIARVLRPAPPPPPQRPKLRLVVNTDTVRPVFGKIGRAVEID